MKSIFVELLRDNDSAAIESSIPNLIESIKAYPAGKQIDIFTQIDGTPIEVHIDPPNTLTDEYATALSAAIQQSMKMTKRIVNVFSQDQLKKYKQTSYGPYSWGAGETHSANEIASAMKLHSIDFTIAGSGRALIAVEWTFTAAELWGNHLISFDMMYDVNKKAFLGTPGKNPGFDG